MPFCRTKEGTLRLVHEGEEILLDANGSELPAELAASIQGHVNVVVGAERRVSTPDPVVEPEDDEPRGRKKKSE